MRVSEILRRKGATVATIAPDASVSELLGALAQYDVGALVVSINGHSVSGIVSERDIVRSLADYGSATLELAAADLMTVEVVTASPQASIDDLMAAMTERHFRHVPITEHDRLVGLVSIGDVVNAKLRALEIETEQLTSYISGY